MDKEELKQAVDKYVESKELVLMSYPPDYIDDVIEDMKIAFMAGAMWRDEKSTLIGMVALWYYEKFLVLGNSL